MTLMQYDTTDCYMSDVTKLKSLGLTKYHAIKTYPLLNDAQRREDVMGEWRYSATHS